MYLFICRRMAIRLHKEQWNKALEQKISDLNEIIKVKDWNIESLKRQLEDEKEISKNLINQNNILINEKHRIEKQLNVMKKRGRPFKKKPEDSDTESPSPKQRCPRKPRAANTFAVPKDSPTLRKISSEEQDESPQRRKSKGEMKAFPGPSEATEEGPEQGKITREDFENVEAKLSVLHAGDGKESSFQDVTSAMEALYASDLADDDKEKETALPEKKETTSEAPKKKRGRPTGRKRKTELRTTDAGTPDTEEAGSVKPSASESSAHTPGRSRSKRASAQKASLKLQETSDEDEFIRRIDKKKDRKESTSTSLRQSIEADKESSHPNGVESTVSGLERPKKLVKKSMRDSLLSSIVSPISSLNTNDNAMTDSDKESEEKKTDLILSTSMRRN